jgi:hypothetical protein
MTLLTVLLLLLGMTSTSFVAPEGTGYVTYMDGVRVGWYKTQPEAENAYNAALVAEDPNLHEQACVRAWEMAYYWNPDHLRPNGDRWWMGLELGAGTYDEIAVIHALSLRIATDAWLGTPNQAAVRRDPITTYGLCFEPHNNTWVVIARR